MASEYPAKGTVLKKGDGGSSETFATIANIMSITPPNPSRDSLETTKHNDSEMWRTFLPGLIDPGEVSIDVTWDPADTTHDFLTEVAADKANYQVVFPDTASTTWQFEAFVINWEPTGEVDGLMSGTLTLKISGEITEPA